MTNNTGSHAGLFWCIAITVQQQKLVYKKKIMCLDKAGFYYMQCVTAVSTIHQMRQNFPAMRKLSGEYRGYTLGYPVVFLCPCQVSPVQNHHSAAFQMSATVPQRTVSANLSLCFSQLLLLFPFLLEVLLMVDVHL